MRHFGPQGDAPYPGAAPMGSLKRQLLQIVLPLAVLALTINWLIDTTRGGMLPFDTVAYPVLITLYTGCVIVLFLRPQYLLVLELCSFGAFVVYMAAYVSLVWYNWRPSDDLYRFATIPQWIPLIYVAAFFIFETRQALRLALTFFAMLLVPGALCLLARGASGIQSDDMHILIDT